MNCRDSEGTECYNHTEKPHTCPNDQGVTDSEYLPLCYCCPACEQDCVEMAARGGDI